MTITRNTVYSALSAAIAAAPEKERNVLAQALEDYAARFGGTYSRMKAGNNFLSGLLDEIEEACEARTGLEV